jgi:hypothetical protein
MNTGKENQRHGSGHAFSLCGASFLPHSASVIAFASQPQPAQPIRRNRVSPAHACASTGDPARRQLSQIRKKRKTMSNIFKKIGVGIADIGKWIAKAITDTVSLAAKVEAILKAEQPLGASFVSGLSTVVADVEALVAASGTAVSASGLNLPADSAAFKELVTLIDDFGKLAPIVGEALAILEGKPVTPTTTASTPAAAK